MINHSANSSVQIALSHYDTGVRTTFAKYEDVRQYFRPIELYFATDYMLLNNDSWEMSENVCETAIRSICKDISDENLEILKKLVIFAMRKSTNKGFYLCFKPYYIYEQ